MTPLLDLAPLLALALKEMVTSLALAVAMVLPGDILTALESLSLRRAALALPALARSLSPIGVGRDPPVPCEDVEATGEAALGGKPGGGWSPDPEGRGGGEGGEAKMEALLPDRVVWDTLTMPVRGSWGLVSVSTSTTLVTGPCSARGPPPGISCWQGQGGGRPASAE